MLFQGFYFKFCQYLRNQNKVILLFGNFYKMRKKINLESYEISEVIEMALSDHASFDHIRSQFDIDENEVKDIMKQNLKRGSYRAWRKRVNTFSKRREFYK